MPYKTILEKIISEEIKTYPKGLSKDRAFEFYCMKNILANFGLTNQQIQQGIVDGKNDGGIDGLYIFIDSVLLSDETEIDKIRERPEIQLIIVQAKNTESFAEKTFDSMCVSIPALLNPHFERKELCRSYREEIVGAFKDFLDIYIQTSSKYPRITVKIFYCCKGDRIGNALEFKSEALKRELASTFSNVEIKFFGAKDLYDRSGLQKTLVKKIPCKAQPLAGLNFHLALVSLRDYADFIKGEDGSVLARIFEANVRDYQGQNEVNEEISQSLQSQNDNLDFWWLNNGVTILVEEAWHNGVELIVSNPLIVNGLQTSYEIHNQDSKLSLDSKRSVLIRVLQENDPEKRDRIIRATNRQTGIDHPSFLANDEIQIEIEDFLKANGIYYDRRKNEHKNLRRSSSAVINIKNLAQSVLSFVLEEPHTARGRPTLVLKDERKNRIFNIDRAAQPLDVYVVSARLFFAVDKHFRKIAKAEDRIFRNNLKFHVLMVLGWLLAGRKSLSPLALSKLNLETDLQDEIQKTYNWVKQKFIEMGPENATAMNAKFTEFLKKKWRPAKGKKS